MKREERNELAATAFSTAWDRESNLPSNDRMREACGAMLDVFVTRYKATASPVVLAQIDAQRPPIVFDEIKDATIVKRAWPTLQRVAAQHGYEVKDLLGSWREFIVARDEACWALAAEIRMEQQDIANLLGRTQQAISLAIGRHRKRQLEAATTNERSVASGRR